MAAIKDDIHVGQITLIAVVGGAVTIAIIFALQIMFFKMEDAEIERKKTGLNLREREAVATEQDAILANYALDKETGTYSIPIKQAMDIVVKELGSK